MHPHFSGNIFQDHRLKILSSLLKEFWLIGYNGLSNLKGDLIVQPHYEFITYAGDGLFRVEQGDQVGYFDSEGKWVWDLSR